MSYYISPRFLDKLAVHISKSFLNLPGVRVPLILGIHGRKGEGKTFQCELVFEKMGFEPVVISGGELESPDAGDPSRLIRLRYREVAEQVKVRGAGKRESKSHPAAGIVEFIHRAYKQDGTLVAECRRQAFMRKRPA